VGSVKAMFLPLVLSQHRWLGRARARLAHARSAPCAIAAARSST